MRKEKQEKKVEKNSICDNGDAAAINANIRKHRDDYMLSYIWRTNG